MLSGVYHLFYQDHLGIGGGITWGHVRPPTLGVPLPSTAVAAVAAAATATVAAHLLILMLVLGCRSFPAT